MPGQRYLQPYANRRLNEIVIVGAHDAGVFTANKDNVQTQALNIRKQASAGCRFFDMRIATHKSTKIFGKSTYENRAYHLKDTAVRDHSLKSEGSKTSYQNVGHLGGWGAGLDDMLDQAKGFVEKYDTEFLILKFSKCFNWRNVAETCIARLGDVHYKAGGNLNNKTVGQLAGKVITVFDEEARKHLTPLIAEQKGHPHGILFIRALYDKDSGRSKVYDPGAWGIQYFGKFSSTPKVDKNTQKQRQILATNGATHMDALGMMYWTTTAMRGNIRTRNDGMWTATNVAALQQTWESGLEAAIEHRFGNEYQSAMRLAQSTGGMLGGRAKAFMPNIVMIDFVDRGRCDTIDALNQVAATSLQQLMIPAPKGPQAAPQVGRTYNRLSDLT
jgi:hypothetical protein